MPTIKLTPAQEKLKTQFDNGRRIKTVNGHHMSGGEYRFTDNQELCRYRTFWNLMSALYGNGVKITNVRELYFEI